MVLSDHSFGSRILFREERELFNTLADKRSSSYQNAYMMLSLLCAFERFLSKEDIQNSITKILGALDEFRGHNIEETTEILTLLTIIGEENEKLANTLKRRLRNIFKMHPEMHKRILGAPKRKRFRKKSHSPPS